ncbi:amidohydrolase [Croceicoccus estronivorus]|uniref:N-acyl-D-amino-acid deacylase family protein n=1 Tax=Croceicoccus estronivorus TaxID=1172626 RepID=UPI00082CE6BD|nr:amidohydrolase family protein [Croceicoccus estronivorus]OCC23600.1 amidohydrolase [Croceicoccus estronivorus]
MYDLVILNGFVIDGTGVSRRQADVAIRDGRIVGIGRFARSEARRSIDAEGHVVAPGIIDAHTHYDPQLTFEPYGTSSCFHGVTSVVTGNCGFAMSPTRAADRKYMSSIFTRVEEIGANAMAAIAWDFETFPEYLAARTGKIGINAAFYIGHSNIRRWVLGDESNQRAATDDEVAEMRMIVRDAMAAGAAGLSSSHSPTDLDMEDRPVPSRLSSRQELLALADEVGRANKGTIGYLPLSAMGGLSAEDGELLVEMALASRRPIIIQGLGARSKVEAPTATWPESEKYLESCRQRGAAVYSLLISRPFNRPVCLARNTSMYEGVPAFHRLFKTDSLAERMAMLRDPAYRDEIRYAVENPNSDPAKGSNTPPPAFNLMLVGKTRRPDNAVLEGRRLTEIAEERGCAPMDVMADLALSEDLETEFIWNTETDEWREGTFLASRHPQMIIGTSDGGAHLGRDDNAEFTSYFFKYWVREWGKWSLEEAIREFTMLPAKILGFNDRGIIAEGYAADIMIFDPETIGPDIKVIAHDLPGGDSRWTSRPKGVKATIVNGVPIVLDGRLLDDCGLPGHVLRPGVSL